MLRTMKENDADVVYGQRRSRAGMAGSKSTRPVFLSATGAAADILIPVDTGDFRLMSRRVSDIIAMMPERDRFIRGNGGFRGFQQIPFSLDGERYKGYEAHSRK
jgi:dolichol-phosphate mannosyltransferase